MKDANAHAQTSGGNKRFERLCSTPYRYAPSKTSIATRCAVAAKGFWLPVITAATSAAGGMSPPDVRILSPLTVDLMRRNQLPRGMKEMQPGIGFGLDFPVIDDMVAADGSREVRTAYHRDTSGCIS